MFGLWEGLTDIMPASGSNIPLLIWPLPLKLKRYFSHMLS